MALAILQKICTKCGAGFATHRHTRKHCDDCRAKITTILLPANHDPKIRDCMCCKRQFVSEGNHNRLCVYCRQHERPDAFGFSQPRRIPAGGVA